MGKVVTTAEFYLNSSLYDFVAILALMVGSVIPLSSSVKVPFKPLTKLDEAAGTL